ncbi:MAG TPA: hypothetical protein VIV11_19930 [Kofleriaceae bacterium]
MRAAFAIIAVLVAAPAFAEQAPPAPSRPNGIPLPETVTAREPRITHVPRLDDKPRIVRGETIIVRGKAPPVKMPKGKKRYGRIAPPYSDWMMEHDVWAKAWLLLDIDERGVVTRLKLLKKPGYDLDQIAIDRGFSMRFDPAEDANGNPMATQLITPIEWPAYWWLITREGIATKIPDYIERVPCYGSGPWKMGSIHKAYRDCSPAPDLATLDQFAWIEKK